MRRYGPQAFVERDWSRPFDGVTVHLASFNDGTIDVAQPVDIVFAAEPRSVGAVPVREPFMRLSEDHARALYDALAEHFGGYQGVRSLRADYDAERQRVDKMLSALCDIAGWRVAT